MFKIRHQILVFMLLLFSLATTANAKPSPDWVKSKLEDLPGLWEKQGYGELVNITETEVSIIQVGENHCLVIGTFDIQQFSSGVSKYPYVWLNQEGNQIKTDPATNLDAHEYTYQLLKEFPASCKNGPTAPTTNPMVNFDIFWKAINNRYAYLDVRNVDWIAQYNKHIDVVSKLTESEDDQKILFDIFASMITSLDRDGHSSISKGGSGVWAHSLRELEARSLEEFAETFTEQTLQTGFAAQDKFKDFDAYKAYVFNEVFIPTLAKQHTAIISSYMKSGLSSALDGKLQWGMMDKNIGYVQINSMDIEDKLTVLDKIDQTMLTIIKELEKTDAIVLDIRSNGGGYDKVGFTIAKYFFDKRQTVLNKWVREGDQLFGPVKIEIEPAKKQYLKPLYILASAQTASAAETFLLTMKALPQVTIVGEPTNGIFSDVFARNLPNGMMLTLSNEIYKDNNGKSYEYAGIEPDEVALMLDKDYRNKAQDSALELVLAKFNSGKPDSGGGSMGGLLVLISLLLAKPLRRVLLTKK